MNSQLFWLSPFPCLLYVIILVFIEFPLSLSNPCMPFTCGNITTGYPFTGDDQLEYCGHPGFILACEQGKTMIEINDVRYQVINVDNKNQILKIARKDYLSDGICPPQLANNSTFDTTLFDLVPGYDLFTLSYGCPSYVHRVFTCPMSGVNYGVGSVEPGLAYPGDCNTCVTVPLAHKPPMTYWNSTILEQALKDGFALKWKVSSPACHECSMSNGTCVYDYLSSQFPCYCPNQPHPVSKTCPRKGSKKQEFAVGFVIALSAAGFVAVAIILICALRRNLLPAKAMIFWKKKTENDQIEEFIKSYGTLTPKRYSYSDVKKMTKSFTHKLGQGGYGGVYKGKLPDGRPVAVKILSELKGNGEDFINEVASISRTSHVNVVTLVGFCYERTKRALIYEFMPNGSLDKFIYDQESSHTCRNLQWKTLYQIAVGTARGLDYLHRGCNTRILHFDIKPHNILLDEDLSPKISDFGLAKLCTRKESIISMLGARGTAGYIAPEVFCRNFGGVSHKSDVYSYGMMVLEIVGGRKNINVRVSNTSEIYFPHWIYKQIEPGEDLRLHGDMTEREEEIARKMIIVGLWCIQINPLDRPSMTKVVEMLEGSFQSLQIPPMPTLSSPRKSLEHSSSISSSSP